MFYRAGLGAFPLLSSSPVLPRALPQQEHLEEHLCARLHLVSHPPFVPFPSASLFHGVTLKIRDPPRLSSLSFISHGISHCYSSFRSDVRGNAPSFYWTYLLSVCAGGGAWLLLWATVNRCGRRGILLLFMTMTGLASLILLGLMECKSTAGCDFYSNHQGDLTIV